MAKLTSDKEGVHILVDVLVHKGIKRVVVSPGSRNAPLLITLAREEQIEHFVVLDERSAAFMALGMVQQSGEPVALVCTSGTALLNYAPAVAEAYYRRLPLIVISADRPVEWVDQDDSQTIRQNGLLGPIVKASYVLPGEILQEEERWYANRLVNDALDTAVRGRKGPVHINVPLREPLYGLQSYPVQLPRMMETVEPASVPVSEKEQKLLEQFRQCRRVMILAGCHLPDEHLEEALKLLSSLPQLVILWETPANVGRDYGIGTIDRVLAAIAEEEKSAYAPELLITFGGPLISKHIKTFLRKYPPHWHWSIDRSEHPVDTLKVLSAQVLLEAGDFFSWLAGKAETGDSHYASCWYRKKLQVTQRHREFAERVPWSDWKAFSVILPALPEGCTLQLANSTPVRYAQLFEYPQVGRTDGNRGTSGIDGSVSTAVGVAWLNPGITVLITGDMSFLYDSNALWNNYISPRLKIIVMKNGGGGIFRFIPGPSDLPELEEFFETACEVDVEGFARLHHFRYFYAAKAEELQEILPDFWTLTDCPAILAVETPREANAEILKSYFRELKGDYI